MNTQPDDHRDDFVSDAEIAKRWRVGERTARIAIRQLERRAGFPKRDPLFGNKRYWPAVRAFLASRYRLNMAHTAIDGEEKFDAPQDQRSARPRLAPSH